MSRKYVNKTTLQDELIGGVILLGFALRLRQYFFNRSLWLDEAFIAVAIRDGSWKEACIPPLEYSHVVPPLFCALSKLVITLLGPQDYIFRLVPLFFGCGALVLFYYLVSRIFAKNHWPVVLAVALFSCSPAMIYYSAEYKQYAGDVFFSVLMLWLWKRWTDCPNDGWNPLWMLCGGFVGTWFSFPLIFLLFAMGVDIWVNLQWKRLGVYRWTVLLVPVLWGVNFLLMDLWLIRPATINNPLYPWLLHFWGDLEKAFLPADIRRWGFWVVRTVYMLFIEYRGIPLQYGCGGALFLLGFVYLYLQQRRFFFLGLMIALFVILASRFKAYPAGGRMLLFIHPCLIIILAAGASFLFVLAHRRKLRAGGVILLGMLMVFIFRNYGLMALHDAGHPIERQEMKPILEYLHEHKMPDDSIYVYYWTEPAFRFYAQDYGFDFNHFQAFAGRPSTQYVYEVCCARAQREVTKPNNNNLRLGCAFTSASVMNELKTMEKDSKITWMILTHMPGPAYEELISMLGTRYALAARYEKTGCTLLKLDMGAVLADPEGEEREKAGK